MNATQHSLLAFTVAHFQEVARQNRFPENNQITHDADRCVICHPELLPQDPFATYLEVVAQSVKIRRPVLDDDLVATINGDRELLGLPPNVTLESLQTNDSEALEVLRGWLQDAFSTGLDLLAIHSPTSREFSLDETTTPDLRALVATKIDDIIGYQQERYQAT